MFRPGIKSGPPRWEATSIEEPFEQFVYIYLEHLHVNARPLEIARDSTVFQFKTEGAVFIFSDCPVPGNKIILNLKV